MNVLACVKRVPMVGASIALTEDGQRIDTRFLGFTVSPHEECAVEEAVRIAQATDGRSTVLTLGSPESIEQLRDTLAMGVNDAVLIATDGREWGPQATAAAIAEAIRSRADSGAPFDLLLFGNEAADTGDYQVPIRVAHHLGLPCVTGIKSLTLAGADICAGREYGGVMETYRLTLPAVVAVREGINLPRYPSLPGRIKAKKAAVETRTGSPVAEGLVRRQLRVPPGSRRQSELLGTGAEAVPKMVEILQGLGLVRQ